MEPGSLQSPSDDVTGVELRKDAVAGTSPVKSPAARLDSEAVFSPDNEAQLGTEAALNFLCGGFCCLPLTVITGCLTVRFGTDGRLVDRSTGLLLARLDKGAEDRELLRSKDPRLVRDGVREVIFDDDPTFLPEEVVLSDFFGVLLATLFSGATTFLDSTAVLGWCF